METLKFLITTDTYPPYSNGGDAKHVFLLSNELVNKGHEVHVLSNFNAYSMLAKKYNWNPKKIQEKQNDNNITRYFLNSPRGNLEPILTYVFGKSFYYDIKYKEILNKIRPDVVHHHDITFLGHNFFKKQGNYTQLYTAHNAWLVCPNRELIRFGKICATPSLCSSCLLYSKRPPQIWRWGKCINKIIEDIDVIIAPSEYMKNKLNIKLNNNRIITLSNFITGPKKEIQSSGYVNYFLFVGRLEEGKGIMKLLNTFNKHANEISANLIIAGSGSLEYKIKGFIRKNGMDKKVLLLGKVDAEKLWSLYRDAIALIVPSIYPENNPLVALEALSTGTPVIGTNAGGVGEIIAKVDRRLIYERDGWNQIKMMLDNKNLYSKKKIIEVYNQWYSPEVFLDKYIKLVFKKEGDEFL